MIEALFDDMNQLTFHIIFMISVGLFFFVKWILSIAESYLKLFQIIYLYIAKS